LSTSTGLSLQFVYIPFPFKGNVLKKLGLQSQNSKKE